MGSVGESSSIVVPRVALIALALIAWGSVCQAATSNFTVLHFFSDDTNGAIPYGSLIESGSTLYGMTYSGGNNPTGGKLGTIFSIDKNTGNETLLHSFTSSDGDR